MKGEIKPVEYYTNPIVTKSGQERIISWHNTFLRDERNVINSTLSSGEDITERKREEEIVLQTLELYRSLVRTSPDAITLTDLKGNIIVASQQTAKLHGFKNTDELVGRSAFDFIAPLERRRAKENLKKVLKSGVVWNLEYTLLKKDHSVFVGELSTSVVKNAQGEPEAFIGITRNITERKNTQKELLLIKFVIDHMKDAAFWIAPQGKFLYVNEAACSLLGYSRNEFLSKTVNDIDLNFPKKKWLERWKAIKRKKTAVVISSYRKKNGEVFPVEITGNYLKYDGKDYLCVIVRDITERNRAQEALQDSEQEKKTILDSVSELVVHQDKDMRLGWANKAATEAFGFSPEKLKGQYCHELWRKRKVFCTTCPVGRVYKTGKPEAADVTSADGRSWFIRGYPVKDKKGKVIGVVEVATDISERKEVEEAIKSALVKSRRILEETVIALAATAERRDPYTAGHQRRVALLACAIAKELGLNEDRIEGIRLAAIIHDVGKVYVPSEILSKPAKLTDIEFSIIKTHPQVGYDILKPVEFPWPVAIFVLQHHERINGSGYPSGISDEEILQEAKILAVADVVEAMASHRPYRAARGINEALNEIKKNKNILYDGRIVDACVRVFKKKHFKFEQNIS
jgi:PAS domain S-box-containing protein